MNRKAFTLVELSIVLVILGLLVGGVLSGQSLIRASELRAIVTEKDKYIVALNAFKDKYFALPGDMKNAYAFWGTDCGTDTDDIDTGCNGNGNGKIEFSADGGTTSEVPKVWEHLSRAGLIEGNYNGQTYGGVGAVVSLTNMPASKFPSGFWDLDSEPYNAWGKVGSVYLHLGNVNQGNTSNIDLLPGLTNGEAWNIDTKVDDGHAVTGTTRGDGEVNCGDDGTDYYQIAAMGADTAGQCVLHFIIQ